MTKQQLVEGTAALSGIQPRIIRIMGTERPKDARIRVAAFYLLDMRVSFIRAQYSQKEKMWYCSIKMLPPL